jgi:hypothetical protein
MASIIRHAKSAIRTMSAQHTARVNGHLSPPDFRAVFMSIMLSLRSMAARMMPSPQLRARNVEPYFSFHQREDSDECDVGRAHQLHR